MTEATWGHSAELIASVFLVQRRIGEEPNPPKPALELTNLQPQRGAMRKVPCPPTPYSHPLPPCLLQLYLWEEPVRQVFAAKETLLFLEETGQAPILGLVTTSGQEKMCLKRKDPTPSLYVFLFLKTQLQQILKCAALFPSSIRLFSFS